MLILKNNKCDLRKKNINVTINQVVKKQETQTSPRFTGATPGLKNEIEKEKK